MLTTLTPAQAATALDLSEVAVAIVDRQQNVAWCSEAFERLATDWSVESRVELLDAVLRQRPAEETRPPAEGLIPADRGGAGHDRDDNRFAWTASPPGGGGPLRVATRRLPESGELVVVLTPQTAERADDRRGPPAAPVDAVTGLPDRGSLQVYLDTRHRDHRRCFALLFIDVDGFKQINDEHGHLIGDRALRSLAERVRHSLREQDYLARFGGDEFVAIVEGVGDRVALSPILERIHASVGAPLRVKDSEVRLSATIGASLSTDRHASAEAMVAAADAAMYATRAADPRRRR